ncbi:hypothetical protein M9Y10_021953 [Tritrichomonas musculus]|uniref:Uncharacterized protein n=1 Tax=Tritrichomonas musculus TaxID=1915356 RepID=A0ABR2KR61_9EUKA
MQTIITRPNNSNTGEHLIEADKFIINTDDMPKCKQYYRQQAPNMQLDDFKKMKEELLHTKLCLNKSHKDFKNKKKDFEELVGICNQNQVTSNVTHLSFPAVPTSTSTSNTTNNNNQKPVISTNHIPTANQKSKPEVSTSINTRIIQPKSTDQTQKTSSRNDRSLNPNPKVRNERSARAIDRNITPTSGNALDIWNRSAPLFLPLPTVEEIDDICRPIDTDALVVNNPMKQHWSDRLREIVKNSQKETKKSKSNQILMPPGKPPAPDDISDYWVKRTPPFQIEEMQKHNKSILHCLLSAFVEAKPLPESEEKNDLLNEDFLPIHVLLPQLEFDDYMSHPFEERLELELRSAGLEKPKEGINSVNNAFATEIDGYKKEIKELQPKIDKIRDEIVEKLPECRKDEDRRMTEAQEYTELLKECRKDHKKT